MCSSRVAFPMPRSHSYVFVHKRRFKPPLLRHRAHYSARKRRVTNTPLQGGYLDKRRLANVVVKCERTKTDVNGLKAQKRIFLPPLL